MPPDDTLTAYWPAGGRSACDWMEALEDPANQMAARCQADYLAKLIRFKLKLL